MGASASQLGMEATTSVSFTINGKEFSVSSEQNPEIGVNSMLVDFIRNEAGLKGTKYMCREGGCGACVVMVATRDPTTGKPVYRAVNSCLTPVLHCDGYEINTIEALGNKKLGYHEIQKRLTTFSGSQCGFCTPGMIMNMYSLKTSKSNLTAKEIEDNFDGNICRCTGYRPILDAFKSMASDAPEELRQKCIDIEECTIKPCQLREDFLSQAKSPGEGGGNVYLRFQSGEQWLKPENFEGLFKAIHKFQAEAVSYRLVGGNTAIGVYKQDGPYSAYIDISSVTDLQANKIEKSGVTLGGGTTLAAAIELLEVASKEEGFEYTAAVSQHLRRTANVPVRNVATLAGNLMIKNAHNEFPSDVFILMESIEAKVNVATAPSLQTQHSVAEFLEMDMSGKVIVSFLLPALPSKAGYRFRSFKIARRHQNSHAYVNAGFLFKLDPTNFTVLEKPSICYGGINNTFVHATETETYFVGKTLTDLKAIQGALATLDEEIIPDSRPPDGTPEYRKSLTGSLLYKTILGFLGSKVKPSLQSGGDNISHLLTSGKQTFDEDEADWPLNKPIPKLESFIQCSGEAEYINDIRPHIGELSAALVLTSQSNADLKSIDSTEASKVPGFIKILQATDIPGPNNYMIFDDEPEEIMVKYKVKAAGQVAAIVVASSRASALLAAKKVKIQYDNIKKPVLTILDAIKEAKETDIFTKTVEVRKKGVSGPETNTIKGEFRIGGQYHLHMETQISICVPNDEGMDIYSSTQWVDHIQGAVASALRIPNNSINVQVKRLGGAYGAKISRATHVAVLCAVAADNLNKPVRLELDLEENMKAIGKRLPYLTTYEVGFNDDGKIGKLSCDIICDCGVGSQENTSHFAKTCAQSCYDATGWIVKAGKVNTNTVTNTYCRSPGSTQGIAIIETIMEHIAAYLKKDPLEVRMNNLLTPGDRLLRKYSLSHPKSDIEKIFVGENYLPKMIANIKISGQYEDRKKFVSDFNKNNRWKKRGMALVPMRYPIDYFSTFFPAYVTIYHEDGTVAVVHGGVEIGQGINTKVAQVVAHTLKIPLENVRVKPTNNLVSPNSQSTGGSITSEFVCFAAMQSCKVLHKRMAPIKEKMKGATWEKLVAACYDEGIDLRGQYWPSESDELKGYDVWGVNLTEVEVDMLTGEYKIVRVDVIEDAGKSMSQAIDVGQVEGATIMGLGLWTMEKLAYDEDTGQLLTANTWNYKVPLPKDIPEDFRVTLLQNAPNPLGILRSKAVGEPPLCISVCVLFALRNAIDSARSDAGNTDYYQLDGPVTPEDVLRLSLSSKNNFVL